MRPARPYSPLAVTPAVLFAWWLVAHNSGAGWVQALGDVVFGTLVVGILGPVVALRRTRLRVVRAPIDAAAGEEADLFLEASARVRVRSIDPPSSMTFLGPVARRGRSDDLITLAPERRGVYEHLTFDLASAAPFGLQWWTRRVEVPLASALLVAPRRGEAELLRLSAHDDEGEEAGRMRAEAGQPRGARPYSPGDSRRLVHWQATAHSGKLMVRELEGPSSTPVTIDVTLPPDPDEAERVAERAFATVARLIEQGVSVRLGTLERSGTVLGIVNDRRALGRRLAKAVSLPGDLSVAIGIAISP